MHFYFVFPFPWEVTGRGSAGLPKMEGRVSAGVAQHCSSVETLGKFVSCGALDLLMSLARAQPPLDDTGLSCVTHAIFRRPGTVG